MLLIRWENELNRWLDQIPTEWLNLSEGNGLKHYSLYNDKTISICYCDLRRIENEIIIDYEGPLNGPKNEFEVGVSVIRLDNTGFPLKHVGWIEKGVHSDYFGEFLGEMPTFKEGSEILVNHKKRERSKKLRQLKIMLTMCDTGKLACEACNFDFNEVYGDIAHNYCEVHHNEKIAGGETINGPEDLAIVCANCHRAIHQSEKDGQMITIGQLSARLVRQAK